ncbi:MAG: PP2C family protein-serine/threonine phosphatase [Armatimonadota bacterium]
MRNVGVPERQSTITTLADVAHELSSIRDWEGRVDDVTQTACELFPASTVAVGARLEEWKVFYCRPPSDTRELELTLLHHYSLLTGESRSPLVADREFLGRVGMVITQTGAQAGSFVSLPIISADRIYGVLHVRSSEPDAYSLEDVSTVSVIASQLGSYLGNVLAYEQQVKVGEEIDRLREEAERRALEAEEATTREGEARAMVQHQLDLLQLAMMPSEVIIGNGYKSSARYIPVPGGQIGGDFYDVMHREDSGVVILMGDVSGKGIEAAAQAVTARSTVRAFAYELKSPSDVLEHANSVLQQSLGQFITVFLAVLDPPSGRICYSSAGHPPPVIYRADGHMELLGKSNLPLGIRTHHKYENGEARLGPGDKIVLYTDGVSEAHRGPELFGTDGISRILKEHGHEPTGKITEELLSASIAWARGSINDDNALIVIERLPHH